MLTSVVFAQNTADITNIGVTGNVLNLSTGLPWSNTVQGQAGGYSGGYTPAYNPVTGNIIFGYSTQTVSQNIAINQALANAGTGIQLAGYSYSWGINNDLLNSGGNRGTLTGNVSLISSSGNALESYNYNYSQTNTGGNFQTFTGSQLFNNQYPLSSVSTLTVSFTGKDQNFWAGYYGPRVHVNYFDLLYSVNPCTTNPAYSPTCAGFSNIVTSSNLVSNPNLVVSGDAVGYNSFAINTALKNSGSGVEVYGFNYGYNYSLGNGTFGCTATNQDGSCSWYMTTNPTAQVKVRLTDSSNNQIYLTGQTWSTPNTAENVSYKFLLPNTTNSLSLGTFTMSALTSGNAAVQNMFTTALYKPDPCVDPLYSSTCPGYAAAYAKQMVLNTVTSPPPAAAPPAAAAAPPVAAANPPQPQNSGSTIVDNTNPINTSATSSTPIGSVSASPTVVSAPAPPPAAAAPSASSQSASVSNSGSTSSNTQSGGSAKESSGSGTSIGLSVVAKNQQQTQATAIAAAATATAQAQQAGTTAQQTAVSVAATAASNAIASGQLALKTSTSPNSSVMSGANNNNSTSSLSQAMASGNTVMAAMGPNTSASSTNQKQDQSNTSSSTNTQTFTTTSQGFSNNSQTTTTANTAVAMISPTQSQNINNVSVLTSIPQTSQTTSVLQSNNTIVTPIQEINSSVSIYSLLPPSQVIVQPYISPNISSFELTSSVPTVTYQSPLTVSSSQGAVALQTPLQISDRFSPINQVSDNKVAIPTTNTVVETGPVVNKNAQNNEAAGKVDINKMATAPSGYGNYLTLTLKDANFYAPKEVYKNQKNVDNARAFRSLASDSKHQQLVDLQYK